MPEDKPDLIILVHGTFANSNDDVGSRWWQSESPFSKALNKRLEGKARCAGPGDVFHWSGENLETDRRLASLKLADRFEELEELGQPYHVIAHSHGGNVLLSAIFRWRGDLKFLRSWSTVGTPFFRFNMRRWTMPGIVLPGVLILFGTIVWLSGLASRNPDGSKPNPADWGALDVGLSRAGLSLAILGWILFAAFLHNGGPLAEMLLDEQFRKKRQRYWPYRWLAIWSAEDEAVAGLTNASGEIDPYLPRAKRSSKHSVILSTGSAIARTLFVSGWRHASLMSRVLYSSCRWMFWIPAQLCYAAAWLVESIMIPVRNGMIGAIERLVTSALRTTAFGDDSVGSMITGVRACPFDSKTGIPPISDDITAAMVCRVNDNLRKSRLLPEGRSLLAQVAFGGMPRDEVKRKVKTHFSDGVLVHTSYFDIEKDKDGNDKDSAIVEMLALHIESSRGDAPTSTNPELAKWVDEFYSQTDQRERQPASK